MCENSVDQTDGNNGIEQFVFDAENQERRSWKFCNSISLPRSEVVFFTQVLIIFLLMTLCSVKLLFYDLECEEMSIWVAILSSTVWYILPNPQL